MWWAGGGRGDRIEAAPEYRAVCGPGVSEPFFGIGGGCLPPPGISSSCSSSDSVFFATPNSASITDPGVSPFPPSNMSCRQWATTGNIQGIQGRQANEQANGGGGTRMLSGVRSIPLPLILPATTSSTFLLYQKQHAPTANNPSTPKTIASGSDIPSDLCATLQSHFYATSMPLLCNFYAPPNAGRKKAMLGSCSHRPSALIASLTPSKPAAELASGGASTTPPPSMAAPKGPTAGKVMCKFVGQAVGKAVGGRGKARSMQS